MTVPVKTPVISYSEDGATLGPFEFDWQLFDASDLHVRRKTAGSAYAIVPPSAYSVSGVGNPAGGSIMLAASVAGATLTISRRTAIRQPTVYTPNDDFPAKSHEGALDRQAIISQDLQLQIAELIARVALAPDGEAGLVFPGAAQRAGLFLAFDAAGNATVAALPTGSLAGSVASYFAGLPDSDPGIVGLPWLNGGVLTISSGVSPT